MSCATQPSRSLTRATLAIREASHWKTAGTSHVPSVLLPRSLLGVAEVSQDLRGGFGFLTSWLS
eukprot:2557351-Amphidinium_carterae.2